MKNKKNKVKCTVFIAIFPWHRNIINISKTVFKEEYLLKKSKYFLEINIQKQYKLFKLAIV
jgi:hypothetical protein